MAEKAMIYGLIAQAMQKVGAIGKDSTATNGNGKQMYKFRGIDAVYNALNPVFAELGLFVCPEVLEQTREERKTTNGGNLIYSILKVKFTIFAPDGSNVSCVVIGEGMDSGDKASNKAMSVAFKYAAFELLCIPTEEMIDPDAEVHDNVLPKNTPNTPPAAASVNKVPSVPPVAQNTPPAAENTPPEKPVNPVLDYLANERANLRTARKIGVGENKALWNKQVEVLTAAGLVPKKPLSEFTMMEAQSLVSYMYTRFAPTGTELKTDDGQAS